MAETASSPFENPKHLAAREKFADKGRENERVALGAIDLLERRVRNATAEIDLGGGDLIKVRTRLSKPEALRIKAAYDAIAVIMAKVQREVTVDGETVVEQIRPPTDKETAAIEDASNRLFSLILYDPVRTPDEIFAFLRDNPGAFSDADQATIFLTYRWISEDEAKKRENLRKFRPV